MAINLDRLRQVIGGAVPRGAPGASAAADPDTAIERVDAPAGPVDAGRVAALLAGHCVESRDGSVIVVDRHYGADRLHGSEPIGRLVETLAGGDEALELLGRAWPSRGPAAPRRHDNDGGAERDIRTREGPPPGPTRLCFFDLETTGLAGGAGTQAFLVGCAIVEDGGIRVRQFLLPGFEHERALLALLGEWAAAQGTLVTFNGRSFDVPLIETRYLLHRLAFPLGEVPHLDMLHPARRLWKQRPLVAGPPLDEDSCRLSVLERHLAGYHRVGDVPGFEIPSRFFRFVRSGDARPLGAVLEHNRIDLVSLALVLARAVTLIQRGPGAARHPRECLGLGRLYERAGGREEAEASYAAAAAFAARVGHEPDVQAEALRRLAVCRRRAGRMAEAAEAWRTLVDLAGCPSVLRREAREALAIHHEHRSRDLVAARRLVLDVLADGPLSPRRDQAIYRLHRLERKLARADDRLDDRLPLGLSS